MISRRIYIDHKTRDILEDIDALSTKDRKKTIIYSHKTYITPILYKGHDLVIVFRTFKPDVKVRYGRTLIYTTLDRCTRCIINSINTYVKYLYPKCVPLSESEMVFLVDYLDVPTKIYDDDLHGWMVTVHIRGVIQEKMCTHIDYKLLSIRRSKY